MPRASPAPRHPAQPAAGGFAATEWRLLTELPAEVMITAIAAQDGGPRRTVAEGLAGLDAIAAGRASDSDLVRAVVAAIFAEPEPDEDRQSATDRAQVLDDCRRATDILRASADPADAAAYRHWLQQVAVRVCHATRAGGVLGVGADQVGDAGVSSRERAFLDELAAALS
jgi:hypothetical protein